MSTHTRRSIKVEEESASGEIPSGDYVILEDVSDEDIQAFLEERDREKEPGFWNLPTIAGLSIITVGVAYLLQMMGLSILPDMSKIIAALPWAAGALIILLGFGVLSWSPSRKKSREKKKSARVETVESEGPKVKVKVDREKDRKKRLTKSKTNRKLAGVCGGLGEYFGVDPTLIRIAFVVATIFGGGFPAVPLYIVLAIIMSNPDKKPKNRKEEKVVIVRESE